MSNDPKFIAFRKSVNTFLFRESGKKLSDLSEPYPGYVWANYCQGVSPEVTALDVIEHNIGSGSIV